MDESRRVGASAGAEASVDDELGAGDEAGVVADEEGDRGRELVDVRAAAERGLVEHPARVLALVHGAEDTAGQQGVDADSEVGPLEGGGAGEAEDARLAGAV